MSEPGEGVHRLSVPADHGQFYLQNLEFHGAWMKEHGTDPELPAAGWTDAACQHHRIGVEPHSISVATAQDDTVPVTVRVHAAAPPRDLDEADHGRPARRRLIDGNPQRARTGVRWRDLPERI